MISFIHEIRVRVWQYWELHLTNLVFITTMLSNVFFMGKSNCLKNARCDFKKQLAVCVSNKQINMKNGCYEKIVKHFQYRRAFKYMITYESIWVELHNVWLAKHIRVKARSPLTVTTGSKARLLCVFISISPQETSAEPKQINYALFSWGVIGLKLNKHAFELLGLFLVNAP